MVCSLSVSATGIAAILMDFDLQVANTTSLELGDVCGDLYGERRGADNQPLTMHLFKNGAGLQKSEMDYFCRDVSFSTGSDEITYVFKFILAEGATSAVIVDLEMAELTNTALYDAEYNVAFGMAEPDWTKAEKIGLNQNYIVDDSNPFIWLRAKLSIKTEEIARIVDTSATWSFQFKFEGVAVNENS